MRHVFQVHQLGAPYLAQQVLVVRQAHAHFAGYFRLQRAAAQLLLQPVHGVLDVFLALARAAAHPVTLAQLVEHGAPDALGGEGFKLHALRDFIARQSFGQPHHADLDQVIQFDIGRQLGDHVVRNPPYQRYMLADHGIAIKLAFGGVHREGVMHW